MSPLLALPSPDLVIETGLSVGAVVSTTNVCSSVVTLPALSVAVTVTVLSPLASIANAPLFGVTLPVSTDHAPPVAVRAYVAPAMTTEIDTSASAVPDTVGVVSLDKAPEVIDNAG